MEKAPEIRKELKALGIELASALKQIRSSREFKELEHEVASGIKNISTSLAKSLKAAAKSPETKKIGSHLKRVAQAGAAQGKVEARRAQKVAVSNLKKVRKAVQTLSGKLRKTHRNGASK